MQNSAVQTTVDSIVVQALPSSLLDEKRVYQAARASVPPVMQATVSDTCSLLCL